MPPVCRIEPPEDSALRRWQGWFARLLIPLVVLFTGLVAETVAARGADPQDTAQAAAPPMAADEARRQAGLAANRHGPAMVDYKLRRQQPSPADAGADPSVLPATLAVAYVAAAAAPSALPPADGVAPGRYPPARPRAPPA